MDSKKSVDKSNMAYSNKGMKAPRPEAYGKADQSAAPKTEPSMQHKEPSASYQYPKAGEQSMKPDHQKKALPSMDAPAGVKGVNEGEKMDANEHYHNPLADRK